ncbi:MAG: helix-turn-helix transcriptional regulator [Hamadaea sp.]|nr:helix-turn-helix transcriptional regulator [Hamadaea sp.]
MDDLGAMLRQARENAGWSLGKFAKAANLDKGYLSRVERGRQEVSATVVLAYQRVLGDDNVNRRELLNRLGATMIAPAAASELIYHGFESALSGRKRSEDEWLELVDSYGRDYMSLGAGEVQTRLAGDLVVLQQQIEQPRLWAVAARLMTVNGKTLPTNDQRQGAIHWYRLASVAADRSEDVATRVWVRGRSALALAYEGAALPVASQLADQALALSDAPTLGRLNALVAKAHVAAILGDRRTSEEALNEARRVFDRAGSDDSASDFNVPEWRFWTFVSMLLSRTGDPRAVEAQDAADRTRPQDLQRFATHIELHRGLYMAKSGDVNAGIAYAHRALSALPTEKRSLSLRLMIAEVEATAGTSSISAPHGAR